MLKNGTILSLMLLVGACSGGSPATVQMYTPAGTSQSYTPSGLGRFDQAKSVFANAEAMNKACAQAAKNDLRIHGITETFPIDSPSSASAKQLADKTRPSASQSKDIVLWNQLSNKCGEDLLVAVSSIAPGLKDVLRPGMKNGDDIIDKLSRRKLTSGEAIKELRANSEATKKQAEPYMRSVIASLAQQDQTDLAQRQLAQAQLQAAQARQDAEMAGLQAQMQSTANSFQNDASRFQQLGTSYRPPQVYTPQLNSTGFAYCRQATGMITTCH